MGSALLAGMLLCMLAWTSHVAKTVGRRPCRYFEHGDDARAVVQWTIVVVGVRHIAWRNAHGKLTCTLMQRDCTLALLSHLPLAAAGT